MITEANINQQRDRESNQRKMKRAYFSIPFDWLS